MGKRNEIEISIDILRLARRGAIKSHLVYQANLNFKLVEKYLQHLKQASLLTGPNDARRFTTTEKGLKYIDHFEALQQYVGEA